MPNTQIQKNQAALNFPRKHRDDEQTATSISSTRGDYLCHQQ